ncbi:hypothetical protein AG4045_028066 [Apium graveolens]|uniref:SHSP domain-containing protein n=1 Tax=Apium graveolens TaxID=4045 RepID=A0A6L5BBE4_APIGR|nr:hypothetical protein AG4045_028066 [Apium graveolens]
MAVYCEVERMGYALRVWEEMGMKGLERDLVAYNTIIGGFCKVGEVKRAEEFFGKMELNGVDGSCVTYEHLVSGYCKIGDVDSALLLYKGMCRKGFRPENFTVDEVINGLCGKNTVSEKLEYLMVAVKKLDSVPKNTEKRIGKFIMKLVLFENANFQTVKAFYQDNVLTVPVDKLPPPEPKKPKIMKVKIS